MQAQWLLWQPTCSTLNECPKYLTLPLALGQIILCTATCVCSTCTYMRETHVRRACDPRVLDKLPLDGTVPQVKPSFLQYNLFSLVKLHDIR